MTYQQTDSQGFHIGQVAELTPGAIDTEAPIYNKATEKAKWDGVKWVIDTIENWNKPPVLTQAQIDKQANLERIAELNKLLTDSDFKFTGDYDQKDTPEWLALKTDRQSWREEIRTLELSL